jgi:pyrimidine operon attenuation protein/uracil phosphoribosyltransferase
MEKQILDQESIHRAVVRISHEVLEHNHGTRDLVLLGIRTRGVFLAQRIQAQIHAIEHEEVPLGILDITLYRDDLKEIGPRPAVRETTMPCDIAGKTVVLIDDVLYTGRTVRAALDAVIDFGRPQAIQLAVLIDRGHREFPIKADYVGKNIPTSKIEEVVVRLDEKDGGDEVVVLEKQ